MSRRMSFWLTRPQMYARTKTVTRRRAVTWKGIKPGDRIIAIEKGQGLKKGEPQTVIHDIEVVSVRIERLDAITREDCILEGFPEMEPEDFVAMFPQPASSAVKRIEFKHL
jgi:hypothetical protein